MMATSPQYYRPTTLAEAVKYAQQPDSIALAGGALTLVGVTLPYAHIIDLQDLDQLKQIEPQADGLHVGGAVRLQALVDSPHVPDLLKGTLTRTVTPNLRNGASVGEGVASLMAPRPLVEWLAALVALDAVVQHNQDGELQEHPVEQFVNTVRRPDYRGFVTQIILPPLDPGSLVGTAWVARTPADHPIVNAVVRVTLSDTGMVTQACTVLGGASEAPVLRIDLVNLVGNPLTDSYVEHTVKPIPSLVNPVPDYKGSVDYRREMARVCVRRALQQCLDSITQDSAE
jgi:CO/xanthine dehydrogenase FAD-binding subunit